MLQIPERAFIVKKSFKGLRALKIILLSYFDSIIQRNDDDELVAAAGQDLLYHDFHNKIINKLAITGIITSLFSTFFIIIIK